MFITCLHCLLTKEFHNFGTKLLRPVSPVSDMRQTMKWYQTPTKLNRKIDTEPNQLQYFDTKKIFDISEISESILSILHAPKMTYKYSYKNLSCRPLFISHLPRSSHGRPIVHLYSFLKLILSISVKFIFFLIW